MRCILLSVPSRQSVPESRKETGEYCGAHNFMATVTQKDGFACCLHPGLPPEEFLGLRQGKVTVLLQQSCGRADLCLPQTKDKVIYCLVSGITVPWFQDIE